MRTYVNIKNELVVYPDKTYPYSERNHKIKCGKCKSYLKTIYTKKFNKQTKLGYYCELCKIGFMNKTTGKYYLVELEKTKCKRI